MVATDQMKTRLHRLIVEENDPAVLELVDSVLSRPSAQETGNDDWSADDRIALEEGLADIKAGRVKPWEEVESNLIAQHLEQEEQKFREELTNLNAASNSFAFLADEEELYSLKDLKERYR